jgi:hypothetical protein
MQDLNELDDFECKNYSYFTITLNEIIEKFPCLLNSSIVSNINQDILDEIFKSNLRKFDDVIYISWDKTDEKHFGKKGEDFLEKL